MILRKLGFILSLTLLLYLLISSVMHIDIAASMNDALISMEKSEIDSTQDITTLKTKAKEELDTIRRIHKNNSKTATLNFSLILLLIGLQFILVRRTKSN